MPLKDKEKRKDAARDRQRKHRQGVTQEGVTGQGVTGETIPLREIKELLPKDIVADIIAVSEYDRIHERNITLEGRFRRAYKYHVWHNENFIGGVHKDLEATELSNGV